jgi:hypothetical protein
MTLLRGRHRGPAPISAPRAALIAQQQATLAAALAKLDELIGPAGPK